ncbi:MAG: hypothetical protein ACXVBF_13035 [Flavisolibacter sp.]
MNRLTKSVLITGLIFFVYGYLSRKFNLYFFWDAKTIGGILLVVALLLFLINLRRNRKQQRKKIIWVTLGICFLAFGLVLFPVIAVIFHASDAYHIATEYIKSNPKIREQVGEVRSFGLIPGGIIQTTTINGVETGSAILEMTVNGSKKNMDASIELKKEPDSEWTVTSFKSL